MATPNLSSTPPASSSTGTLKSVLSRLENSIRNRATEKGYVLDRQGNVLLSREGTNAGIDWAEYETDYFAGNILTHNHPSNRSFSYDDLSTALRDRLSEIRAVSKDYDHSFKFHMRPDSATFDRWFKEVDDRIYKQLKAKIDAGEITIDQAEQMQAHLRSQTFQARWPSCVTYERHALQGALGSSMLPKRGTAATKASGVGQTAQKRDYYTVADRASRAQPAPRQSPVPGQTLGVTAAEVAKRTVLGFAAGLAAAALIDPVKNRSVDWVAPAKEKHPVAHEAVRFAADVAAKALEDSAALGATAGPVAATFPFTPPSLARKAAVVAAGYGVQYLLAQRRAKQQAGSETPKAPTETVLTDPPMPPDPQAEQRAFLDSERAHGFTVYVEEAVRSM